MEADAKETTGITRGQNAVHVVPMDWSTLARVAAPVLERLDASRAEPQLLVITADAESAASAASALVPAASAHGLRVVVATQSPRAARLLRTSSAAQIVVGAPAELVALQQASALKPDGVRALAFAWLDVILESPEAQPLETLLGEMPKEAPRVVLASALTPAHEALIERYARRARREVEPAAEGEAPLSAEYVAAPAAGRGDALRRLLDTLDLPAAVLYARDERLRDEASRVARALGYPAGEVRTASTAGEATGDAPLVLLDLPATREEMRALAGGSGRRIYAVVQPSQLDSLRALLGNGALAPVALMDAAERARGRDAALRASLRDVLTSSDVRREVLAIEPLLGEFDGVEIAAAALRLLEQQRPARPAPAAAKPPMTNLFVNLGERDGVRPQELVAAITSSAGLPTSQIGRIEVRDTHSLVEVAATVAELVAGKLTGSVVRGRRVQARVDQPREARESRGRPGERGARPGGPRGGAPRGERRDRGDRPDRGERSDRGERGPRAFGREGGARKPFSRDASDRRPPRDAADRRPPRAASPPRDRRDEP